MNKPETSPSRGRRWRRLAIELLIVVLIFLALKSWLQRDMISGEAPDFQAHLLDGTPVSLADYRGAPVLVHFWATWCGICRLEQGSIEAISHSWPVLTVAMQSGDADTLAAYMAEQGYTQAVIADEDGALAARFGVGAVPASFVVDAEGHIRFRERGLTTGWGLRLRLWLARIL
ncbi:Peroxiredoxin [Ectothiorhodospira magna]|uniref:Peroxiredoxin n=1 Tax=Ectothiorhodospira magna TaxID=867345 RepID=A0A1H9DNT8_9GAMM|nr:protein disulfide oxidoreductase [Ectothiorhodospira magna]SEQ15180.1 Peroxiredoxin [Ectothiorhodospira magna]